MYIYISISLQRRLFRFFFPGVNSKNKSFVRKLPEFLVKKKIEQKNAGRLLVAPTPFFARNFMSSGSFSKIKSNVPFQTAQNWENKYPRKFSYCSGK
jgi:hypothetical protein